MADVLPSLQTITSNPLLQQARADRPRPVKPPRAPARPAPIEPEESPVRERWRRIERQLVENWTGILGTVVVVVGITFIGAYAGPRLSPLLRSVLITGAAALLASLRA